MMYWIPAIVIAVDLVLRLVMHRKPGAEARGSTSYLRIAVNAIALVALGAAALTASQTKLTGDLLLRHVTVAPVFALAAAAAVVLWADRNRFRPEDGARLISPATWAIPLRKVFFWCAMVLAIPAMIAIVAAMFPLFGTDDQQDLVAVHRYCAQSAAAASFLFAYFALVAWRERSGD